MALIVKSHENADLSCVISMAYRGYTIVLQHDPQSYSFCVIATPNREILQGVRFSCDMHGIRRASAVVDALVD